MVTARHDSSGDSVDDWLVSEGRLKRMQRERRITPAAGKEKPPAWKYLVRLLKPYCDEEVTKNMLVLLFEVKETNIEIIQRILALSDELRPNVKDIMLIYETYIQSDKCSKLGFPGGYSTQEILDAMAWIRKRNEGMRPKRSSTPATSRLTGGWQRNVIRKQREHRIAGREDYPKGCDGCKDHTARTQSSPSSSDSSSETPPEVRAHEFWEKADRMTPEEKKRAHQTQWASAIQDFWKEEEEKDKYRNHSKK